ncbi:MAG: pitrilysin family protein, partial [Candidatus Polarisedimenticolia bacterium]
MKLSRPLAALAALVLGSGTLWAMDNPLPKLKIDEYRLSNGLTVFLLEDHSAPTVAVNINYMVGSKDEKPGRTGFAHLFEHMMFQASGHRPGLYINAIQEIGGAVNGGTNSDRTRYWEVVPAGYLERALWLEADRMGYLLDALDKERLDNQISVVQNEKRQNYDNRPYGLVREKIASVLYPDNHPYHWLTIGSMADLSASSVDDVKEFFRAYYTPNNAALCIAGDFDPAAAKALVEKYFGSLPPGPPVSRPGRWTPRLEGETELFIQDRVELARTQIVWATPPVFDADEAALNVFGQILGGGKTSRLYKRLVHELGIAQDVSASNDARQLAGEFQILLVPKPGRTLAEVEREARAVLAEALDKGVSAE